ncbi:hypothetical protein V8G54_011225 [Vigna mungo]|uniref:glucose-1-phosphate adenylyltransferase n=1 Tax=Vigna mungo TaxID=3915 RepID=A0AAQ3RZE9_VIGMU
MLNTNVGCHHIGWKCWNSTLSSYPHKSQARCFHWRELHTDRYSYEQLHQQWHQESVCFNSFQLLLPQCPLNAHLSHTYNFGNGVNFGGGFVEVLAATQIPGEFGSKWFQGTTDVVRRFTWVFEDAKNKSTEHIMIIYGDHLCRMDYMQLVETHSENNVDITVSCVPMDESLLGLSAEEAEKYPFLSLMRVFVFRTEVLLKLLRWSCPS